MDPIITEIIKTVSVYIAHAVFDDNISFKASAQLTWSQCWAQGGLWDMLGGAVCHRSWKVSRAEYDVNLLVLLTCMNSISGLKDSLFQAMLMYRESCYPN